MIRRPPRSTLSSSSAASDVYKRQVLARGCVEQDGACDWATDRCRGDRRRNRAPGQQQADHEWCCYARTLGRRRQPAPAHNLRTAAAAQDARPANEPESPVPRPVFSAWESAHIRFFAVSSAGRAPCTTVARVSPALLTAGPELKRAGVACLALRGPALGLLMNGMTPLPRCASA